MRAILILILVQFLVSCTDNKTVVISEMNLESDKFYCTNAYEAFNGTCKVIYDNTEITKLESAYKDGILDGQTILFHKDGTPYRKGRYVSGQHDGLWEGWFKNGKKEFAIHYECGKLNGEYIAYYQNGSVKEKGEYQNDTRISEWITYDKNGNEISKKVY